MSICLSEDILIKECRIQLKRGIVHQDSASVIIGFLSQALSRPIRRNYMHPIVPYNSYGLLSEKFRTILIRLEKNMPVPLSARKCKQLWLVWLCMSFECCSVHFSSQHLEGRCGGGSILGLYD